MRVKPLQWTGAREPNRQVRRHHMRAATPWGEYRIEWWGHEEEAPYTQVCLYGPGTVGLGTGEMLVGGYHDIEDAQRAAQADLEGRIGTVIETEQEMRHAA